MRFTPTKPPSMTSLGHVETAMSRALSKRIITTCFAKTLLLPRTCQEQKFRHHHPHVSNKKTHKNASSLITYHNSSCQRQQVVKELAVSQPRTCVVELSALGEVVIE